MVITVFHLVFLKRLAEKHGEFGILQIDAHCDLREAYEGFNYSHASIMYNALNEIPQLKRLVQVGVRDYVATNGNISKTATTVSSLILIKR